MVLKKVDRSVRYKEAIGDIKTIVKTPKIIKILEDCHKILILYGATGNGKSMLATLKAITRIMNSPRHHRFFVLAGKDITTLEKRFIESPNSVLNWKPFKPFWKYTKQGVAGAKVTFQTPTGKKYWYLTPFADAKTYSRVLGSTINGAFVDEAPESNEDFLKEVFVRTIRTQGSWAILTGNGGDPKHYFYTGIVDKCKTVEDVFTKEQMVEYDIKPTPQEELKFLMTEFNDEGDIKIHENSIMYHLSLEDNPVYTEEQLRMFRSLYPKGSFMYYSRILGIRGFQEKNVFSAYVNERMIVPLSIVKETDAVGHFKNPHLLPYRMVFSVDSGGHVFSNSAFNGIMPESRYIQGDFGTEIGGHTVMISASFDKSYKNIMILDTFFPNEMEQWLNVEKINRKIIELGELFPYARKEFLFCDPADSSMLATLINRIRNVNDVRPAIKRDSDLGLDEKLIIGFIQQFMMTGRFKILDTPNNRKFLIPSLISAKQEENGKMFDNGSWEADVWDALKYIFMSMYRLLIET